MSAVRKPIFDAVRATVPNVWANPLNIQALDNLLDAFGVPRQDAGRTTSAKGIELIHSFEGYAFALADGSVRAYPDPATGGKPWTIGWGSTSDENGRPIEPGTIWTRERADARFRQHLGEFEAQVSKALGSSATTQGQFDAMVSLAYNVGVGNFSSSTLLRKHKAGDYAGAKAEFARWNRAGGKVMAGLTRRRAAEAALYAT